MTERRVIHVVPYVNGWTLNETGRAEERGELGAWDHKDFAIERAKDLAKSALLGQVVVHGEDGRIQEEFTYGEDPVRHPG